MPLREEIHRLRGKKVFTFGVAAPFSSHRHLLRKWLSAQGVDPDRDVRIVIVPPPQMVANLQGRQSGMVFVWANLGMPPPQMRGWAFSLPPVRSWNRIPKKVLMVQREFAEKRSEEHIRLVAALLEA